MRRILVLLSVVALMVGMMVVTVSPVFAVPDGGYGKESNYGHWCEPTCGTHGDFDRGWHGEGNYGNHGTGDDGLHGEGNRGVGNIP